MKKTVKKTDFKHKQWFRADIDGEECIGRVSIGNDGRIYLCQNTMDGSTAPDKLGFDYSWCVFKGSARSLKDHNVANLILLSRKPVSFKMHAALPNIGDYRVRITNDGNTVRVGCTPVSRELYLEVGRIAGWIE